MAGTTDVAVVAVTKVSSAVCFLQQSDCVEAKMKTIDFILDGKFHLHTPKKRRV
jgi:hypothetical protein